MNPTRKSFCPTGDSKANGGRTFTLTVLYSVQLWIVLQCLAPTGLAQKADLERHLRQAQQYLDQEKYSPAIGELKKAIALDALLPGAQNQLGYCHWKLGQFSEAQRAFETELKLEPASSYAHYYLGRILLGDSKAAEAIPHFEKALTDSPVPDVYHQLGLACLQAKKLDLAIAHLQKAVKLTPDKSDTRISLGRAYALAGRKSDAQRELGLASALKEREQTAIREFARCETLLKQEKPDEAVAVARELAQSQDPDLLLNLGVLLGRYRLYREALPPLERAASLRPQFFEAYYNIGLSLSSSRDFVRASEALQEAVRLKPASYEAQSLLGLVMIQRGKDDEAIAALERAVEIRPDDFRLLGLLGSKYLEKQNHDAASKTLRKAVDLQPDDPQLRFMLMQAYRTLGRQQDAAKEEEALRRLDDQRKRGQETKRDKPDQP